MPKSIWESSQWIHHGLGDMETNNKNFRDSMDKKAQLAVQFLLYDNVVIPTKDFGIVPILVEWFGMYGLLHLLHYKVFSFSWMRDQLGYSGNGLGIRFYGVEKPSSGWENWQQVARWGEMELAAEAQIHNAIPTNWCKCIRNELLDAVLMNSSITEFPTSQNLSFETSRDISTSAKLLDILAKLQPNPTTRVNLNSLPGIKSNEFRSIAPGNISDSIGFVLRVAEINLEFYAARTIENCDVGVPEGADLLLESKLVRNGANSTQLDRFLSLLELENIPDIRNPLISRELTIRDFIKIRDSRKAVKFRKWLHSLDARDPRELEQLYVATLGKKRSAGWPQKTIRLACTTGAGVFDGSLGVMAGAVDSFVLDSWIDGFTPRLFMDELRAIS